MIRITKSEKNAETNTIRMANSHYFKGEEDAVVKYRNPLILLSAGDRTRTGTLFWNEGF